MRKNKSQFPDAARVFDQERVQPDPTVPAEPSDPIDNDRDGTEKD
jgi:hypothetical protein